MLLLRVNFNLLPATAAWTNQPSSVQSSALLEKRATTKVKNEPSSECSRRASAAPRPCRCLNGNELAPVPRVIYDQGKWWKQHHRQKVTIGSRVSSSSTVVSVKIELLKNYRRPQLRENLGQNCFEVEDKKSSLWFSSVFCYTAISLNLFSQHLIASPRTFKDTAVALYISKQLEILSIILLRVVLVNCSIFLHYRTNLSIFCLRPHYRFKIDDDFGTET